MVQSYRVTVQKVRMSRVHITRLHPNLAVNICLSHVILTVNTHATISDTNFVVGLMAVLKKFTTTLLNLSRSAGYRLKDC